MFWVYNVVFGIQYVGVLNAISLFLIIGVGVDDCFIFYNTFMQVGGGGGEEEEERGRRRRRRLTIVYSWLMCKIWARVCQ